MQERALQMPGKSALVANERQGVFGFSVYMQSSFEQSGNKYLYITNQTLYHMKVYVKCTCCSEEIGYRTYTHTRVEFAMREGETKSLTCKKCKTKADYHVDTFYAKTSKTALVITAIILFIGTPLAFLLIIPVINTSGRHYTTYIVGGFLLIPIISYTIINQQDIRRVSDFNKRKLKGRIHNIG
ncbi:hypothetical protein [Sinomicrobium sp. M5D2P17]